MSPVTSATVLATWGRMCARVKTQCPMREACTLSSAIDGWIMESKIDRIGALVKKGYGLRHAKNIVEAQDRASALKKLDVYTERPPLDHRRRHRADAGGGD